MGSTAASTASARCGPFTPQLTSNRRLRLLNEMTPLHDDASNDRLPTAYYATPPRSLRKESFESTASWPVTFEEGVDSRLASPSAQTLMRQRSQGLSYHSTPDKHRIVAERLEQGLQARLVEDETTPRQAVVATPKDTRASFSEAVFNAINVLLGVGVLSSPFALRSSGLAIGLSLFVFCALVTNHTGKLLGKCLQYQEGMMTYPDIGLAAFGTKGRLLICVVFFTELFTVGAMLLILVGDTLHALIPGYTSLELSIVAFIVILPTFWTAHLSMLSYLSILGVVASLFCLYAVVYIGLAINPSDPGYTMGSVLHPQPLQWIAESDRIPLSIGLTMAAFGGHSVFPSICSSMKNPAEYSRMLDLTYVVVVIVYGTIEILGYLMFGTNTSKEITLNLIGVYPGWLTQAVTWMIVINPLSKIALTEHPIALALEELVLTRDQMLHETPRVKVIRAVIRSAIGTSALVFALSVPHFARVMSFLGAFFAILASIVLPCTCYLKLYWPKLGLGERVFNATLAMFALILAVIGSVASFMSPAD